MLRGGKHLIGNMPVMLLGFLVGLNVYKMILDAAGCLFLLKWPGNRFGPDVHPNVA